MKTFLAMSIIAFATLFSGLFFRSLWGLLIAAVAFAAAFAWLGFCSQEDSRHGGP